MNIHLQSERERRPLRDMIDRLTAEPEICPYDIQLRSKKYWKNSYAIASTMETCLHCRFESPNIDDQRLPFRMLREACYLGNRVLEMRYLRSRTFLSQILPFL